jgi:hypothetical protein
MATIENAWYLRNVLTANAPVGPRGSRYRFRMAGKCLRRPVFAIGQIGAPATVSICRHPTHNSEFNSD